MDFAGWGIRGRQSLVGDRERKGKERMVVTDAATGNRVSLWKF